MKQEQSLKRFRCFDSCRQKLPQLAPALNFFVFLRFLILRIIIFFTSFHISSIIFSTDVVQHTIPLNWLYLTYVSLVEELPQPIWQGISPPPPPLPFPSLTWLMLHWLRWCDAGWRVALNRLAHYNWLGFVRSHPCSLDIGHAYCLIGIDI